MSAAVLLLVAGILFPAFATGAVAYAADDLVTEFERQNVWDDLQNSVIAGEPFRVEDYPHNDAIDPSVVTFVEFGYSYSAEKQDDFGLYLYIYNPNDVAYDLTRNSVQLSCGALSSANYPLGFLNYSNEPGYEGRFYKFKVNLTMPQQREILANVDENARAYTVVSVQLSRKGVAKSYPCAQTYTYSGYSLGYGSELAEESSLTCAVDGFERYVELDVHQTVYRKEGDFYHGKQSQLNSCYFRVPEKYFTDYGDLTKIVAEWYEYIINPILVGSEAYRYFDELNGRNLNDFSPGFDYMIYAIYYRDSSLLFGDKSGVVSLTNLSWDDIKDEYSFWDENGFHKWTIDKSSSEDQPDVGLTFAGVLPGNGASDIEKLYVSESDLRDELLHNSAELGGPYYGDGYSQSLFSDDIELGHTRGRNLKPIHKDDLKGVWWNTTTKDLLQTLFGDYDVDTQYDFINAIVTSEDEDFDLSGSDEAISERLKIGKGDVADLKAEYAKAQLLGERLVLLRYGESTYYAFPCTVSVCGHADGSDETLMRDVMTKSYQNKYDGFIAQETVYLDFDIISLWFKAENGSVTEIPVVMSPQEVISGLTPPLKENYHNDGWEAFVKIIIALLLLILIVVILWPVLPYIIKAVVWVVLLPFRLIKMIVQACKKKPKSNAEAPPDAEKLKEKKTKAEKKR